jgi:hypothetical protein
MSAQLILINFKLFHDAKQQNIDVKLNLDIFHYNGFSQAFLLTKRVRKDTHFIFKKESLIMDQKLETTDHFCNWLHYF